MKKIYFSCVLLIMVITAKAQQASNYTDWSKTHEFGISLGMPLTDKELAILTRADLSPDLKREVSKRMVLPVIGIDYGYNCNHWFKIGVSVAYTYFETPLTSLKDGGVSLKETKNVFQAMVRAGFYWYNGQVLRLYSSAGLGIRMLHGKEIIYDKVNSVAVRTKVLPWYDLCLIGVTVGKRIYGNFQFGAMANGYITAGIGVRF